MKFLIVACLATIAYGQACRGEFKNARDCMRSAIEPHTRDVTAAQADDMADCVSAEVKTCMQQKMGPM